MKKSAVAGSLLIFCAISFVGPWEGARPTLAWDGTAKAVAHPFPSYLPRVPDVSTDSSDLDRRDAQNRPISAPSDVDDLVTLFSANLFNLLVVLPSHEARLAATVAEQNSYLLFSLFLHTTKALAVAFLDTISISKRRVVHNVNKLWITISDGSLDPFGPRFQRTLIERVFFLPLRC